jgi:hypothetical protein
MAHIDVKITTWARYDLTDDVDIEKVRRILEVSPSVDGVIDEMKLNYCESSSGVTYNVIDETEEKLTLEQNDGYSTIELIDDDNNIIWQNGKSI